MLALPAVFAQRTVTGTVTDQEGLPLEGVAVIVRGTTSGAFTDAGGSYAVRVPEGSTILEFRFVGKKTIVATIDRDVIDATLESEDVYTDEVVVTAFGISREKKSLGYATQEVGGEEVTAVKDVNFINSLSGKVAGVNIKRSNQLGGSSNVVIRGYKSLTGNNQALFIVDGIIKGAAATRFTARVPPTVSWSSPPRRAPSARASA
ncbi:MAG: hypothetical protein OHK0039_33670 [Bacteroidia bacterium]